jgi:hypothetical protein
LQRLDDLQSGLLRGLKTAARSRNLVLENLAGRFLRAKPALALKARREALAAAGKKPEFARPGAGFGARLFHHDGRGDGPGFARRGESQAGQKLKTRLAKGEFSSRVEK